MQCANPHCSRELLYLREGRAELIELELGSRDRARTDEGEFAVRSTPSKFFWLCGDCARIFIIKRWTPTGLVLVLRKESMAGSRPTVASSKVLPGSVRESADLAAAIKNSPGPLLREEGCDRGYSALLIQSSAVRSKTCA
jgi:hypothetical protein